VLLIALIGQAAVAPSSAQAYIGESAVETVPGGAPGDTVTTPARTVITNPTFLESEPALASAAGDGETLLEAEAAAGLLPEMAAVLPWVAGAAIGAAVVCNLEIFGSCLEFFGSGTDPSKTPKITWTLSPSGTEFELKTYGGTGSYYVGPGTYYANPGAYREGWEEACGKGTGGELLPSPTEASSLFFFSAKVNCPPEKAEKSRIPLRSGNTSRAVRTTTAKTATYSGAGYCAVGVTCAAKSPTNWAERFAQCLHGVGSQKCGLTESQAERLGQQIASEIPGSGVDSPYRTYVNVPECSGEVWIGCKEALEELQLVPVRHSIDWSDVTTDLPSEVLEMDPVPSTHVATKTKVIVTTNPDVTGMPLVIPEPGPHETYAEYIARLAPGLNPERLYAPEWMVNPSHGPDGVLGVSPDAGTDLNPKTEHTVKVETNPHELPASGAAGGPGGCGTGSLPAIDLSPLNKPLGSRFPFGVFGFFVGWIGEWEVSGVPSFTFTLIPAGTFGSDGLQIPVNLEFMQPMVEPLRLVFLFASFVGLLWFLGTAFLRLNGDSS
jgi:hypothetical protein